MSWLTNIISRRDRQTIKSKLSSGVNFFPRMPAAGVRVDEDVALTYTAIWAAVRIISETIASLSWHVYRQKPGGGREHDHSHPVDWLLHNQPNPEMTPCSFREALQAHALLWGNAYAEIERDRAGRPVWLWPLPPDRVTPKRNDAGAVVYEVRTGTDSRTVTLQAGDVFHLKGLGFDGIIGYSPITMHREAIGMGMAAERFGSSFYGNDSRPGGVITHPNVLSDEARENLKGEFEAAHRGSDNRWKVALLEEGVNWTSVGIPQNDAQYIETRKFQVLEIARIYRLPPHKLGDLDGSIKANIEQQNIEFVSDAILPWACKWEAEANWKLFGRNNQGNVYTKMNLDSLHRADIKSRYDAYAVARNWGWMSANDVRELEDLNPLPSDQNGDVYLIPSNMMPAERALEDPPEPPPVNTPTPIDEPDTDDAGDAGSDDDEPMPARSLGEFQATYRRVFADLMTRAVSRERHRIGDMARSNRAGTTLAKTMRAFYVEHARYMERALTAPAQALADLVGTGAASVRADAVTRALRSFVTDYCAAAGDELTEAMTTNTIPELLELWEIDRPETVSVGLTCALISASRNHHESNQATATA